MSSAVLGRVERDRIAEVAALQQQGRAADAAALCDRLLAGAADDWRVRMLRGLARRQLGDTGAALDDLAAATRLDPAQVEPWLQLAGTQLSVGDREGAAQACRAALQVSGKAPALQFRAGSLLEQCAEPEAAAAAYAAALGADPDHVEALNNLAGLERAHGALAAARTRLERAIALRPDFAPAYLNLAAVCAAEDGRPQAGLAVLRRGLAACGPSMPLEFALGVALLHARDLHAAGRAFAQLVVRDPAHVDALNNLGTVRLTLGEVEAAQALFERALALAPTHAAARSNLGSVLLMIGRAAESAQAYVAAAEADPGLVDAWVGLGAALLELGQPEGAQRCYARALALRPDSVEALAGMGNLLAQTGETARAREHYDAAFALAPDGALDLRRSLLLSPVHASVLALAEERRRFEAEVDRLQAADDPFEEASLLRYADTWFYLAYHGRNDRELRGRLARLLVDRCPSLAHVAPQALVAREPGRPLRVGFVGCFFHNHSVGRFFNPVIEALARDARFEVVVFRLDPRRDALVERLEQTPLRSLGLPSWSLAEARTSIAAQAIDVLVYPEIGMDAFTYLLAFSRLARVQCVLHGHSVTTGVPSIDWFVSSNLIEPDDAQSQFTERLARLSTLPMVLEPLPAAPAATPRAALGLPEDARLYLCPMKLQKVHPEMDAAVAQILRGDPQARVAFVRDPVHPNWQAIVARRLQAAMPDVFDRVCFVPWMNDTAGFIGLLRSADVILDSFHHGGATTAHLCLASGRPVVAWRSGSSRAGFIDGYYRLLGVTGCVADTPAQYVEIALRLGGDAALRAATSAAIERGLPALYRPGDVVAGYAAFLLEVGEAAPAALVPEQYRPLCTALEWSRRSGTPHAVVEPEQAVALRAPVVAGTAPAAMSEVGALPPVYHAELHDMLVTGGESSLRPRSGEAVIDESGARDVDDRFALTDAGYVARVGTQVLVRPAGEAARSLEAAIWLCGRTSNNYYHWLTEYLPRLATLAECPQYAGWPVLVDAGLHPNLLAALRRCLPPGHRLVEVAAGERIAVARLLVLGPRAWMPVDLRPGIAARADDVLFAPSAVRFLRRSLGTEAPRPAVRRLFLRRGPSAYRTLLNEDELQQRLVARGFEVVCPEHLSLEQQVALFAEAAVVVGATGAAFASLVFAPPGCRALVLYYGGAPLQYFANLAQALDVDLRYVHGDPIEGSHPISYQCDFTIETAAVDAALDELLATPQRLHFGFLVHLAEIINHFRPIWEKLPTGSFEVINAGEGAHAEAIGRAVAALGVPCVPLAQRLSEPVRSPVLVSNHPLDPSGAPLIRRLGALNVRLMDVIGKAGWNLSEWNALYDAVLCCGPYQAEALARFDAVKLQVGCPRFDGYFALRGERDALLRRFDCDPTRPTLVWLPTWKGLSSVGHYDGVLASLRRRFNVVVKLHPLMAIEQQEMVAAVRALGFNHVIVDATDNIPLYVVADWVLCDYGDPAFGAILTDRNLLLLDVPGVEADGLTGEASPDIRIREAVVQVSPQARWEIGSLLDDEALWVQQREVRRVVRRVFFAPWAGCASDVAAACLRSLEPIVRDGLG